jgi:hypothetical protein
MRHILPKLELALATHDFHRTKEGRAGCLCRLILKRQTINMNRAIAVVEVDSLPCDPTPLLKKIKKEVAMRCGFFPLFYGIGTQLILVVDGATPAKIDTLRYVDKFDNQWSIIQSVFIVHPDSGLVAEGRTWGQVLTGKYQDIIHETLSLRNEN